MELSQKTQAEIDADFDAEFEREELEQRAEFITKWLHGICYLNLSGSNCGFFIYASGEGHAKVIENQLNERGLVNTDIHPSCEPECGAWVVQASPRAEFEFTGKGIYPEVIAALRGLCKAKRFTPKYLYVDCNQWLVNFKTKKEADIIARDMAKNLAGVKVEIEHKYLTTFTVRMTLRG